MKIINKVIPANSFQRFTLPTSFVYARSLSDTLRIDSDNGGSVKLEQGDVAEYVRQEAVNFVNESGSDLTIELLVGIGGEKFQKAPPSSLTLTGSMAISGFDVDPQIQGISDPLPPTVIGNACHYRNSGSAALQTVVTPAANTGGIVITSLGVLTANTHHRIMIKTSAPSSFADASAITVSLFGDSSYISQFAVPLPLEIPAGYGLYEQQLGGVGVAVSISYEVL